jgi:hypothetical protein
MEGGTAVLEHDIASNVTASGWSKAFSYEQNHIFRLWLEYVHGKTAL